MKSTSVMALALAFLCVSTAAFAKQHKGGSTKTTTQTHHCQLNGAEAHKTKKECLKAGGTWEKGAPGHAAAAPTPAAQ